MVGIIKRMREVKLSGSWGLEWPTQNSYGRRQRNSRRIKIFNVNYIHYTLLVFLLIDINIFHLKYLSH